MGDKLDLQAQEFGFNSVDDLKTYALGMVENAKSIGPFEGLAKTALFSAVPGFLGGSPSAALQGWQARHPVATAIGTIGGMAVPYVGAAKALSMTKVPGAIQNALKIGDKSNAFTRGATTALSYDIPIEAGRLATGAVLGQPVAQAFGGDYQGLLPSAEEAVMNVGAGAIIGGGLGMFASSGRSFIKEAGATAGLPINKQAPYQSQAKEIQGLIAEGKLTESRGRLALNELRDKIFAAEPQASAVFGNEVKGSPLGTQADLGVKVNREKKTIYALEGKNQGIIDILNRQILKVIDNPKHMTKKLTSSEKPGSKEVHFSKVSPVLSADNPNWMFDVGNPRVVTINQERSNLRPVLDKIERGLDKVDDNYFMGYDPVQKLYLLARKLPKNGKHLTDKTSKVGDPFVVMFKTDKPENFIPGIKGFKAQQTRADSFMDDGVLKTELSKNYLHPDTKEPLVVPIHGIGRAHV